MTIPSLSPAVLYSHDDLQYAWVAGYERGLAERVELEAEHRAHAIIHERSVEMLCLARESARPKGEAWLRMIEDQATQDWEGR